ncbi:hypothetical protein PFISCL1PPCAC_1996, partial [Pristionchus fissidentatus]
LGQMNILPTVGVTAKHLLSRGGSNCRAQLRNIAAAAATEYHASEAEMFNELSNKTKGKKLEKIVVNVSMKDGSKKTFLMNKDVSTPFHCASHINKGLADSSVLCIVRDESGAEEMSSMRQPLTTACTLDFISLQSEEHAEIVNQAYWRSCSVLLGSLISSSFNGTVQPVGAVNNQYSDGYFAYDIKSKSLEKWEPSSKDYSSLVLSLYQRMIEKNLPFDALLVNSEEAERFALGQRYTMENKSLLCRIGDHVESVDGPVISHAGQIGRFAVLKASKKSNGIWRFSGVSLPFSQSVSSFNWGIITDHSRKV